MQREQINHGHVLTPALSATEIDFTSVDWKKERQKIIKALEKINRFLSFKEAPTNYNGIPSPKHNISNSKLLKNLNSFFK